MKEYPKSECSCKVCQSCCAYKPGWFLPGEPEKVAEFFGLTIQECFAKYLGVDYWLALDNIFVIAPAITRMRPGRVYPSNPLGVCVFFQNGRCSIHEVKPYECSHSQACKGRSPQHEDVAMAWLPFQNTIQELILSPKPKE